MSDQLTLAAETRERTGKGASRSLRREGRVPAVIYGNNEDPVPVHVEEKALRQILATGHFMNSVIMVDVAGKSARTLPKDVAFDPVSDRPVHVDFLRISEHAKVHVNVPVHFTNDEKAPGIKRGGVLNVVRHELELVCDAASIPRRDRDLARGPRSRRFDPHLERHAARGRRIGDRRPAISPSPRSSRRPRSSRARAIATPKPRPSKPKSPPTRFRPPSSRTRPRPDDTRRPRIASGGG